MKNLIKILGTAILFFGLTSSVNAVNLQSNLTSLSTQSLVSSPYALDCKGTIGGKNCCLVKKDKYKSSNSIGIGDGLTLGSGITTDSSGNIYVSGFTSVGINGQQQHGKRDYFVIKYNASGKMQWTQQVGAAGGYTEGIAIAVDNGGDVYIVGTTDAGINGQQQHGNEDYFIAKYDASGKLLRTQQVGAAGGYTEGIAIAVDNGGNVYVTGRTNVGINGQKQHGEEDYFIAAYVPTGSLIWADQVGATDGSTNGFGIAVDNNGNAYVTGYTTVGINGQKQKGGWDYFIVKYNKNSMQWTQQVGAPRGETASIKIVIDANGNPFITGYTTVGINGQSQHGIQDYFVVKYDPNGNMQWTQQSGISKLTRGNGIAIDSSGNVYLVGFTGISDLGINAQEQDDSNDYFIVKYDANGKLQWSQHVGEPGSQISGNGIITNSNGNVYITGFTNVGINGQPQNGLFDAFIASYNSAGSLLWGRQVGG